MPLLPTHHTAQPLSTLKKGGVGCRQGKQQCIFHRTALNVLISHYAYSTASQIQQLFQDIEGEADCLSPKSILILLQVPGKLAAAAMAPLQSGCSGDATRKQPQGVICALSQRLLRIFEDAQSPRSASCRMVEAQVTPREVALAAWSMGRLEMQHRGLMRLLTSIILGCIQQKQLSQTGTSSPYSVNSIDIANMLWACGKTRFIDTGFIDVLICETARRMRSFDPHSLASVFVALGQMRYKHNNTLIEMKAQDSESVESGSVEGGLYEKLRHFDARKLSNFFWSCARLDWRPVCLLRHASSLLLPMVGSMTAQNVSCVFWACGQLLLHDQTPFLYKVAQATILPLSLNDSSATTTTTNAASAAAPNGLSFDPQGLANILWALGRLRWGPADVLGVLAEQVCRSVHYFSAQQLSNMMWACGRLEYHPDALLNSLLGEIYWKLGDCNAQNISNIYWGLSRCGWQDGNNKNKRQQQHPLVLLLPTLFPTAATSAASLCVIKTIIDRISQFTSQAVANMLTACVYLEWAPPSILEALLIRANAVIQTVGGGMIADSIMDNVMDDAVMEISPCKHPHPIQLDNPAKKTPRRHSVDGGVINNHDHTNIDSVAAVTTQHLATVCWAVGVLLRERHAVIAERDPIGRHAATLFASIANILTTNTNPPFPRHQLLCAYTDAQPRPRSASVSHSHQVSRVSSVPPQSSIASASFVLQGTQLQQLSLVLWGFAAARVRHDGLFRMVTREVARRLDNDDCAFLIPDNVTALCQIMWALGRIDYVAEDFLVRCIERVAEDHDLAYNNDQTASSWFWKHVSVQNVANFTWGMAVLLSNLCYGDGEAPALVKNGVYCGQAEFGPGGGDATHFTISAQLNAQLLKVFAGAAKAVKSIPEEELGPCDAGQLFSAFSLASHLLKFTDEAERGIFEDTRRCLRVRLAPVAPIVSAAHAHVKKRLLLCLQETPREPERGYRVEEEVVTDDMCQSCDLMVTAEGNGEGQHQICCIEIDGPWHFIRYLAEFPGVPGKGDYPGSALLVLGVDGRTRLKRRLLILEGNKGVINLPFHHIAAARLRGEHALDAYLRRKLHEALTHNPLLPTADANQK